MQSFPKQTRPGLGKTAFTLVEMLVVIAIISILMTAGSIGLSGMGGKGVTSGVATAESLFDEARTTAVGRGTRARVLVAMDLTNNPADNLRRIVIAYAEIDPLTGEEATPVKWTLASRGATLPEQVYFSKVYSMYSQANRTGFGATSEMSLSAPTYKATYVGKYLFYEFNSQGICTSPGASFIIGNGARKTTPPTSNPVVTASARRDFGGFVVWRNGRTSLFRSPEQMGIGELTPNTQF